MEPFVGSGAVLFNAAPNRALAADTNKHLIGFYNAIQSGQLTSSNLRSFLQKEGDALRDKGEKHYYDVRTRFNADGSLFDFIFLNRSCFNGMMRFNRKGGFNVPFCRKPDRFRPAYITKICNQVDWARQTMKGKNWDFVVQDWRETLGGVSDSDFVYLDPPYIGRHTDYYNSWTQTDADELAVAIKDLGAGFAYSMWKENKYRTNEHLKEHFSDFPCLVYAHFYHLGPTETLRNEMQEALIVSPRSKAPQDWRELKSELPTQASLVL